MFCLLFVMCHIRSAGQDSAGTKKIRFGGYVEAYYAYDAGQPPAHQRPSFFYSFNRHNELNINLAYLKAAYADEAVRGNLALMAGTYASANLAQESDLLRLIFEANAGIKLSKQKNIWFDAGVLPSHIGFESAVGKDCWTLTRSILADNSPYYEAGARVSYTNRSGRLYLAALYLNGWQRIRKISGNQTPSFGTQLTLKPSQKFMFNWSTYIGNDQPPALSRWRFFNNLYAQWQLTGRLGFLLGFDMGYEQAFRHSGHYYPWYAPIALLRCRLSEKTALSARAEYYNDYFQVIIKSPPGTRFMTAGYSLNIDYLPVANVMMRLEGRVLQGRDKIFRMNGRASRENYAVTTSLAISF